MRCFRSLLLLMIFSPRLNAQPSAAFSPPAIRLTDSVFCTEIKDQSQSPTCWVFGANSLFESDLQKKKNLRLNLSEMYIARYAYIDKARQWLATKGKTYYEGGGQFHDIIRIIDQYGIVPEEVYNGRPGGRSIHNHARLDTAMKKYALGLLANGKTGLDSVATRNLNDTLDRYLGKLPGLFTYKSRQYDPQTFKKAIGLSGDDYIEVMSFASLPFYEKCLLDDKFNWAGDSLYNIPLEDMLSVVDTALARGWSVGWEGDVTEPGFDHWGGYASLNDTVELIETRRLIDFKNESTERDHMLHIVGIGRDSSQKKWYYLKNSWGTFFSRYKGFLFMDENYFKLKTVTMMLNKQALPKSLFDKLGLSVKGE